MLMRKCCDILYNLARFIGSRLERTRGEEEMGGGCKREALAKLNTFYVLRLRRE